MGFAVGDPYSWPDAHDAPIAEQAGRVAKSRDDDWTEREDRWWPRDIVDDGPVRCASCGRIGGPTLDGRCMPGKGCQGFGGAAHAVRVIGGPPASMPEPPPHHPEETR